MDTMWVIPVIELLIFAFLFILVKLKDIKREFKYLENVNERIDKKIANLQDSVRELKYKKRD